MSEYDAMNRIAEGCDYELEHEDDFCHVVDTEIIDASLQPGG